jgi:hypothetical protein
VKFKILFASLLLALIIGCSKDFPNQPNANQPPKTYLTVYADSTIRSTTSQQHLHWWGVDPDGFVKGFYISFDSTKNITDWTFTTSNDSTFGLKLNQMDTVYTFFVAAVDNEGLIDPHPASFKYPIHNSAPTVSFVLNSDVPDTTYPVASFQWIGSDVDGNETITNYFYSLDDTSNSAHWHAISGSSNLLTLDSTNGLTEGNHVFFLKAVDIAGASSSIIRMPKDTSKTWYVKKPKGDFLIIDDYGPVDAAASTYAQIFDTLLSGRLKASDVWDIKTGYSGTSRGKYVPALINPTFTRTLELFKYVFWYSDNNPQLDIAQSSLPDFKRTGGKVLLVTGFGESTPDQRGFGDFAPIDKVESSSFSKILFSKDSLVAVDPNYPNLIRDNSTTIYSFPRGILPKVNAKIIYQMMKSPRWASRDTLPIVMGVKDDQASVIMVSGILHRFVGNPGGGFPNNLPLFFRKVFHDEFGVR